MGNLAVAHVVLRLCRANERSGESVMLDKATVERIAQEYYDAKYEDTHIFSNCFRGPIRAHGYLEEEQLLRIVKWKARRALGWARRNDPETVKLVTGWAFAATDPRLAVHALTYLTGVRVRMASAILTVYAPEEYTVMDVRAWATLQTVGLEKLGLSPTMSPDDEDCETYAAYLTVCKRMAHNLGVSLRTLDRCLYLLNGRTPEQYFAQEGAPADEIKC